MRKITTSDTPVPRVESNCFSTEQFLYDLYLSMPDQLSNDQFKTLDRLCKKIDVVKKLYISYKHDLSLSLSTTLIDPQYKIILISVLLHYAEKTNDFKFLNSAMKLFDSTQNHIDQEIQDLIQKRFIIVLNKLDITL